MSKQSKADKAAVLFFDGENGLELARRGERWTVSEDGATVEVDRKGVIAFCVRVVLPPEEAERVLTAA